MNKLLLALLLFAATARAEPGLDLLGLQHPKFPVKATVELLPPEFIGGNLDWTFGRSLAPLRRVLATGKVKRWRTHFFNGPGLRNKQLGSYEPHARYTAKGFSHVWEQKNPALRNHLKSRVKLYCRLFAEFPTVTFEISPTLEHNLSSKAFREQKRVVVNNCPGVIVVDNPGFGVPFTGLGKHERHGVNPAVGSPCNVSLDGDSAEDVDVPTFLVGYEDCDATFLWSRTFNGRLASGSFIDPRARYAWPTRDQMRAFFRYLQPLAPPQLAQCLPVLAPRLWKPFAEQKGINDPRADKPLWLSPVRLDAVTIHSADNGSLIGVLAYYGPFDGGGHRYYSGTGSNLTAMEMADRSEYVYVREGATCYGAIHPALRYGYFR